ncbi:hypothetical protein JB92DRAFT_2837099 [Gautieria morchelliformis]|nr:hypothetical protein JB92DRAFT_2837099 [Gautieria morchelliformis]
MEEGRLHGRRGVSMGGGVSPREEGHLRGRRGISAGGDTCMAAIMHSHRAASGLRFNLRVRVNVHKNSGKVQVPLLEAGQPASPRPSNLQLSKAGFAIFSSPGELECSNQWSHQKLDEWLREMLPIAFEYMYEVAKDGGEVTWHLLKASHLRLSLNHEVPNRYDFVDAKGGKSKGWQDSKLYLVLSDNHGQCPETDERCHTQTGRKGCIDIKALSL